MAMGDYHACDNCGAKTFYDANLSGFTGPGGVWLYGTEGIVGHRAYALCGKCEQTHEIRILPKGEAELAEAKAEIERLADNGCHLEMLLAAMKARGDRLAEYAVHRRECPTVKGWRQAGNCHCGLKQALTEWRDQHHGGNDADT